MKTKKKSPSAFATRAEVLRFCINEQYSIPIDYHCNLADFKGCSTSQFEKYLKWGHHLNEQAVLHIIETENEKALDIWFKYCADRMSNKAKEAFVQKFGFKPLLKKGVKLEGKLTQSLLAEGNFGLALKYFNQCSFSGREEAFALLRAHNVELTVQFLKQQCYIHEDISSLILTYEEPVVYKILFRYCPFLRGISRGIINKRSLKLFNIMIKEQCEPLPNEDLKLLIQRNEIDMLSAYIEDRGFNPEIISCITENASDEFFAMCVGQGIYLFDSDTWYKRVFKPKNRACLIEFVKQHPLRSGKWEIQLLKSGDSELIEAYKKSPHFSAEAVSYMLSNKLDKAFGVTIHDIETLDWRAETRIFTSGNNALIEEYLFAGRAYSLSITDFGEAMLFRHASIEILDAYMEDTPPCVLAQREIISRWNMAVISLFLHKHNYTFATEVAASFLQNADAELAMRYLQNIENVTYFLSEESTESLQVLCQRKEPEFYQFVLDNAVLDEEEMVLFIRNAPAKLVRKLIEEAPEIFPVAEAEILRRKNRELIKTHIQARGIHKENECLFLSLLDVELIDLLGEDNLVSEEAEDLLYSY